MNNYFWSQYEAVSYGINQSINQSMFKHSKFKRKHNTSGKVESEYDNAVIVYKDDNIISEQSTDDNKKAATIESTSEASSLTSVTTTTDTSLISGTSASASNDSLPYILGGVLLLGGVGAAVAGGGSGDNKVEPTPTTDTQAPVFISGRTATSIEENRGAGQVIYTAKATDNIKVTTYELAGADKNKFSINSSTGEVKLTANPDFETQSTFNFSVIAKDAAGNSTEQAVTLKVNDVDEIPQVPTSIALSDSRIIENQAGVVIATLSTTDADSTAFTYTVDDARFEVVNGVLKLKSGISLDFEQTTSINIQVTATDNTDLSVTQNFTLSVLDVTTETGYINYPNGPVVITSATPKFAPVTTPPDFSINQDYYGQGYPEFVLTMNSATQGEIAPSHFELINGKWYITYKDGEHSVFEIKSSDNSALVTGPCVTNWEDWLNADISTSFTDWVKSGSIATPVAIPTSGTFDLYLTELDNYGDEVYRVHVDFSHKTITHYAITDVLIGSTSFTVEGTKLVLESGNEIQILDSTDNFVLLSETNGINAFNTLYSQTELFDIEYATQSVFSADYAFTFNITLNSGNDLLVSNLPYSDSYPLNSIDASQDSEANMITVTLQDVIEMGVPDESFERRNINITGGTNDSVDIVSTDWVANGNFTDNSGMVFDRYTSSDASLMLDLGIQQGMMVI